MILMPSEVTLQQFDDHPAVMALTLGLPVIATEDVTPASFAIADDNLLGREIAPEPGGAAVLVENLPLAPGGACHATGGELLAAGFGQLGSIVPGIHARVDNEHRPAEVPASHICTDPGHGADIAQTHGGVMR